MESGWAIGVDVGGTKILAGRVARDGTIDGRCELATPRSSQDELLAVIDRAIDKLLNGDVVAVGLGFPSTIDQRAKRIVSTVNLPLADVDIHTPMSNRLGLPVAIENDANAAALAEAWIGAGRGASDFLLVAVGTGIGGGLILGGRPYRGWSGAGGEVGHMVIDRQGPRCSCGGRGHLETLASGRAADLLARSQFGSDADAQLLVELAKRHDRDALALLSGIGDALGTGVVSLVNILDPQRVVIGGGFGVAAAPFLLQTVTKKVRCEALPPQRQRVLVLAAELGSEAGLIGAAFSAFAKLS